ncbi:MAG: aminotransferase class I/II-fold pyridoxal phosphate-dependent enzyme, partial [Christensenellaceae bacterium]|nr:aminotransferase class I/II-fold pyridoxal phosphate-dependent enzyme [Christensenellaceae bacterium]
VCGFGMTETAITSVETDMSLRSRLKASVGRPLSNIDYKIIPNGTNENVGEMLIKSNAIHIAKLEGGKQVDPERIDCDWFPTGDIVRIEKDKRVFVEGRCKDLIINESGENVYPDEIEDFFSVLNNVEQFSVVGIKKHKNDIYEDICLVLNLGENYYNDNFTTQLVNEINNINSKLSVIKRINRVIVTPEKLPLVNVIKVKRLELKSNIENNKIIYKDLSLERKESIKSKSEPQVFVNKSHHELEINEIKNKVADAFSEILEISKDNIQYDAHFIDDLGGDSLQILSLALKVEELFSVNIEVVEYPQCTSINDISSLLYRKIKGLKNYESETERGDFLEKVIPIKNFKDSPEYIEFHEREQSLLKNPEDNPYFVRHESPLLDVSLMDGHEVLNFGSYNYACLSGRKEVNDAAKRAIDKYGTSASGSRLLAGEKQIHRDLEAAIAKFKNAEDAIVLVGGHSTNVTFIGNFCSKKDLILYDALAHNSIEEGCRLSEATAKPFPHNDIKLLEQMLKVHRDKYEKILIVIEGVYSMDGDIADVPAFVALKKRYGCFLFVDEAHSTCVIGENGGGVDEYFNLAPDDIDIKMGTLSKGLGTCGGYLAGSKELINYLRYSLPGFVFSVGISPALAGATLEAINLMQTDKTIMERMRRNIKCFVDQAKKLNFNICLAGETAIIPILVGSDKNAFILSNAMSKNGIFVPPAVYPAVPKNKARLRFCVVSDHKPEQIKHALNTLAAVAKSLDIQLPR